MLVNNQLVCLPPVGIFKPVLSLLGHKATPFSFLMPSGTAHGQRKTTYDPILVPRGRAPFGQHQESRPLAKSNTGSPRFTDYPSLCACSESSLTNLIGSGLNLLCLQSHSKTECRWTRQRSRFLVLTKRSAASGDENAYDPRARSSVSQLLMVVSRLR